MKELDHINQNAELEAELLEDYFLSKEFVRLLNPAKDPMYTSELYQFHLKRMVYLEGLLNTNPAAEKP